MKLTLLHKGLLLVSIPLCFEITIFGALFNLQKQAEVEAQKVARNKKINDAVNHIMIYGIRLGRVRKKYELSEFLSPEFQHNAHELKSNFTELESLTHDDPELSQQVEFSKRSMFAALGHFKDIKEALQTADPATLPGLIRDNRINLDHDIDSARASGLLELADKSLAGTDDARSRLLRDRATTLLKYAVALSVLMGIFGATMFSKHLTRRLQKLGDNASKLARQEALDPPQGGTDEIAELDRSFHFAANLITQATRIRQEVTALITYDLKTPLQSIRSFLQMLEAGELGEVDQQGEALLAISEKESQRMVGLIDNVLQLEQLRTGTLKLDLSTVSVVSLLNKSINAVHIPAEDKNIELVRDFSQSGEEAVQGDPFWLGQVIVNILSNAIKFSPPKTKVTVHTESTAAQVCISITDQGPGIPPEQLDLIFERFHRIEASAAKVSGSGLGLTIARELVEMHNGSIDITSENGRGSTFSIRLPRSKKSLGDTSAPAITRGTT